MATRELKTTTENPIFVFDYDKDRVTEKEAANINECVPLKETPTVSWINIDSVPPISRLHELRLGFDLHPVIEENILDVNQRPMIEVLDPYIFIALQMLSLDEKEKIEKERVSLILAEHFVLTFQEGVRGDTFDPVRNLIRKDGSRLRSFGTDYLSYELIDSAVKNYETIIEHFSDRIEKLEEAVTAIKNQYAITGLYALKRDMLLLRKAVGPLREVIATLQHSESRLIKKETRIYLREISTRLTQIMDSLETYREMLGSMVDVYLSSVNNRTASVMKVLTIVVTVITPLSFLAGFYGMNFEYLPGLSSPRGPAVMITVMLATGLCMLLFFKYKRWF